ncbi:hypothetical protein HYC85_020536 [Camellia sinensis]|uniref:Inositol-pentakisphosphate 2-kinase n=1 Tax=Camellia sinensis TaxID=4442 RepID=A0A7J7GTV1_CAMSI|nr:hypothetical protein HYC85_020536 [Camellia sinensis]
MATPFHLPVTAAQVLQQQLDFVHQFYSEASTVLRIDGNSRETATAMLGRFQQSNDENYTFEAGNGHSALRYIGEMILHLRSSESLSKVVNVPEKHKKLIWQTKGQLNKIFPRLLNIFRHISNRMGLVELSFTVFASNLKGKFSISVEIKPKCGFLPDSRFISEENAIKKRITRFKMHQPLKLHQREISDTSEYDPLDMLSGSKERVHKAITALFCTPQNNFRVFLNGSLIFGGLGGGADITSCMIGNSFEDVLKCVIQADDGLRTTNFLQLVTEAVSRLGLLDRLLEVQKLDIFDIEGAIHAYYDVVSQPCIACRDLGEDKLSGRWSTTTNLISK